MLADKIVNRLQGIDRPNLDVTRAFCKWAIGKCGADNSRIVGAEAKTANLPGFVVAGATFFGIVPFVFCFQLSGLDFPYANISVPGTGRGKLSVGADRNAKHGRRVPFKLGDFVGGNVPNLDLLTRVGNDQSSPVVCKCEPVDSWALGHGTLASASFLAIGITSSVSEQEDQFERSASDLVSKIESAWEDYVHAASIIHGRCRGRDFTRQDFRNLYEYITSDGLEFQAAQFDPNISHAERDFYEQEARDFYQEYYPHVNYTGFRGFNTEDSPSLEPRWNASFYFPIHYMEPVIGNEVGNSYRVEGT